VQDISGVKRLKLLVRFGCVGVSCAVTWADGSLCCLGFKVQEEQAVVGWELFAVKMGVWLVL
jgi:hypothetical protein